jgi:GDPmannose 4,6-dehydratase
MESENIGSFHLLNGDLLDMPSLKNALDESCPDVVFHLGAQSFIPRSFLNPSETMQINCIGTLNLLETIRMKNYEPTIIFAGSSEEYGLVIFSEKQYRRIKEKHGVVFPEPAEIPELPINEMNPLRPLSPYAVSKVFGDYLTRSYRHYGLKTIVSRGFNTEGPGRGPMYVTSIITSQITGLKHGTVDRISIGNVNTFRDWSHIKDIVYGFALLAEKGCYGEVYNQGSMRTNSVLSYILLSLEEAGYEIRKIETLKGEKTIEDPTLMDDSRMFGVEFEKTKVDKLLLDGEVEYTKEDRGILVYTSEGKVLIEFDQRRFRTAEVPISISDTKKIQRLGFKVKYGLKDIIRDQIDYFSKKKTLCEIKEP